MSFRGLHQSAKQGIRPREARRADGRIHGKMVKIDVGISINGGTKYGWFTRENPTEMDDGTHGYP